MRAAKFVVLFWLLLELAIWARDGQGFCVLQALPFAERSEPLSAEFESLMLLVVTTAIWGFLLLTREQPEQTEQPERQPTHTTPRFRTGVILVPATLIGLALFNETVSFRPQFADLFPLARNLPELRFMTVLGLCVIAILVTIKHFRGR